MGIDRAHYHGWNGRLQSPWRATLAMVRVGMLQVIRRKLYWVVLALGLFQFLMYFSIIYTVTQWKLSEMHQDQVLQRFGFSARPEGNQESGFTIFMERQSVVVMILLAFAGSTLVGSDFHQKSLPFYLSRRIDRRHYIVGKLLATSLLIMLLTTTPALILFVEFGMFSSSLDYWLDHAWVPVSIFVYSGVLCAVLSILLVTVSAYLKRLVPIAITWSTIFLVLYQLSLYLTDATGDERWRLIDPWFDIHEAGRLGFAAAATGHERELAAWACVVLVGVCAACLVALTRRVQAVEVVR